jgi:hypothetical protein
MVGEVAKLTRIGMPVGADELVDRPAGGAAVAEQHGAGWCGRKQAAQGIGERLDLVEFDVANPV